MPGLDQLLSRVVERKGYRVQGADAEALLAKKAEETLLAAWKTDGPLSIEDAKMFLAAFGQVNASSGILVATKGCDQPAKDALAAMKTIEIWAESRLVIEVGEAFVKDAIDGAMAQLPSTPLPPTHSSSAPAKTATKFPSLVAQAASAASSASHNGVAYFMPSRRQEQPADMQATIPQQRGGSLGYAWGGMSGSGPTDRGIAQTLPSKPRIKTDQWGNVVKPGAAAAASPAVVDTGDVEITGTPRRRVANPAATGAAPPTVMDADADAYEIISTKKDKPKAPTMKEAALPACSTLKLNVTKEDAVSKAGKSGTPKLALVPHVAFEYNVEMNRPGMPAPVSGAGALLINSLTGELRNVDTLAFNPSEPTEVARKDAEKLTAVDVYDKVKGFMAKTFTKTMNVEKEVAGNTVMSTLKLTPDPDEMGLDHKGIVHLPVWEITTSTGVIKVDAFTGNVL